jgi:hypothetical protein
MVEAFPAHEAKVLSEKKLNLILSLKISSPTL